MKVSEQQMESRVPQHIPGVSSSIMVQPLLDSRVPYGRLQHPLTIFPIDQMKATHIKNDYIDSPAVVVEQPTSQKGLRGTHESLLAVQQQQQQQQHHHHHHHHHHHLQRCDPHDITHPWISFGGRPSSVSSSSSTSSDQRLLDHAAPPPVADHAPPRSVNAQPKSLAPQPLDLKAPAPPEAVKKHAPLCEVCGKCKCTECTLPRTLPSCWVCNQEYLCSAQNLVDSATCMCLVKGIFYHCTNDDDDEGSCADRPCSCSHSNCCARWSFMGALSLVLPCLVCYPPAVGCAKLSQKCYDSASRPGCRCKPPPPACKAAKAKASSGQGNPS